MKGEGEGEEGEPDTEFKMYQQQLARETVKDVDRYVHARKIQTCFFYCSLEHWTTVV
jgi:hypothetical protein